MKLFFVRTALTTFLAALPVTALFAGGDEVVVIYNSAMPESREVADYYAMRREVPRSQVWGFDLSKNEEITRTEFRTTLQQPLLRKLESSKLWTFGKGTMVTTNGETKQVSGMLLQSGIRYAVLCYGVPLKIKSDESLRVAGAGALSRNESAVDTELALLPSLYQRYSLAGPIKNPFHTTTNAATLYPTNGVLMVTRLDGPSAEIARGLVDKAMDAEKNGLWGRAYFDLRSITDPGYKIGDDWLRAAGEICRVLGFEVVVDEQPATFPVSFPMSQIAFYAGWYDGNVSGPLYLGNVEFMPGAFAYHIHSFSADTIRSRDRNWVGPLLARGATITMGCVYEPYLAGTPDIAVFAGRLILYGMTFGEAAYAAQPVLSWQTTIVGDPLYRPFGKTLVQINKELEAAKSPLLEWVQLRFVNLNLANGVPAIQMMAYLEEMPLTKQSAVLSEKLGDVCVKLGKPSSAILAYGKALQLNPSLQQRVRLRLTLAEKLLAAGRESEAYGNYRALIVDEWPNYPGRLEVCHKLQPLAQKLGKTDDVRQWDQLIKLLTPPPPATNSTLPVTGG